ncbi:(deoxy)nucleoside triphosphate pyrophosphohydrolase [Pontixanthobacter aquaemixtae]|uniref:8-oxo-dGTP diphosphatase n=1 Tax=Pontixanthobacter aquaemixtae TaxID=1958940 RepID=A0A844ZRA9_9SPHN|nr:(deoxy)nucleoside triphosphate pyrophosphohydrolase [Pontixanthobacter aquaemixtae]MXO90064.1 NUDIX domain-containing protein [Pontixanthobacter aquaemixtae]
MLVVAAALRRTDGRWLMHKRPQAAHHGGLWEFPGGKVESAETPEIALVREVEEELGISIEAADCMPAGFAQSQAETGRKAIVILLYTLEKWRGEPRALEGEGVGWFTPQEIEALDKPPLDIALAAQLFSRSRSD